MMRQYFAIVPVLLIAALLSACGGAAPASTPAPTAGAQSPSAEPATSTAPAAPTAAPEQPTTAPDATAYPGPGGYPGPSTPAATAPAGGAQAPAELVAAARERLAQHLGVTPDSLTIQAAAAQTWPNTAIGCPAPDQSYQAISIPGYQLTFSDGAQSFDVHTTLLAAPGEPMVLCENQLPVDLTAAAESTPEPAGAAMIDLAKQDLAKALGIDAATITVVSSNAVQWNDSSLGCPKPGQNYLQVITPGYLIRLSAQGQTYEYHTDSKSTVVKCMP